MLYEIIGSKNKEKIVQIFVEFPNRDFTLTELSNKCNISKSGTKEILDVLVEKGFITRSNMSYKLNLNNLIAIHLKKIIDRNEIIKNISKSVKKDFSAFRVHILLIGSVSRSEEKKESDIDFLIICEDKDLLKIRSKASEVSDKLSELYSRDIEIIVLEKNELNKLEKRKDPFYINIIAAHQTIKDDLKVFK
jgi:predicted nucleotidyltransferase